MFSLADISPIFSTEDAPRRVNVRCRNNAAISLMEWKMVKLGRVSKETRGAVVLDYIEDLVIRTPGENYPKG